MTFYPVIEFEIGGHKTRAYLQDETTLLDKADVVGVRTQVEKVFLANKELLDHGEKYVLIVWGDNDQNMIDWWVWGDKESELAGAGIEVYLFRDVKRYESPLVTAEDGLRVLTKECGA